MRIWLLTLIFSALAIACQDDESTLTETSAENTQSIEELKSTEDYKRIRKSVMAGGPKRMSDEEFDRAYAHCVNNGGNVIIGGFGQLACEKQTPDAGQACTQNSDCEGMCMADTKTCSPITPQFGCNKVLPRPNMPATICVD